MTVTLVDVARAAGVSIKTASNVVRAQGKFSEDTAKRVRSAIAELGYKPNLAARGLRSGRVGAISLIVPDIRNPYFSELASAVIEVADQHELLVVLEQSGGEPEAELELLRGRRARLVDGILFSALALTAGNADLAETVTMPVVLLGEPIAGWPTDFVTMPNQSGARAATKHLIDRGRRRILALGRRTGDLVGPAHLRLLGYRQALADAGIGADPMLEIDAGLWQRENAARTVRDALARGTDFDGIVAFNDALALGAIRALQDARIRVPDDVSVIGFDDIEEARFNQPTLTTIKIDLQAMASSAVRFLLRRLDEDSEHRTASEGFISDFTIIERDST
ncbi:LacI family DNA-binding transcriptional regulator [Humibacter sp.]|uniref:LacI family DNA-binding transcriptional regulator n=1 Tax=Humibacter sp. TaxID=1940291 RepID=UPI003F7F1FD0